MEQAGYDVDFVDELPDYLTCIICQLALKNTMLLIDCGHKLCHYCFEGMKKHAAQTGTELSCPHHRTRIDVSKVVEDKGNDRIVLALKVKCKYYTDGCQWTGELQKLEAHLQNSCRFTDEERTHRLLKEFQKRLETCEIHSKEKDKEIAILKEHCKVTKERILSLEQQVEQCNKQLCERNTAPAAYSQISLHHNHLQNSPHLKDIQSSGQSDENGDVKKKLESLQQHIGVIEQLMAHKKAVIKWNVNEYYDHKEKGDVVESPTFYSGVHGHCCKLKIAWFGPLKGRIGIFFHLCAGIYDAELYEDFSMKIKVEMVNREGIVIFSEITPADIDENAADFVFAFGNDSEGYQFKFDDFQYYVNSLRLREFIVDDILLITCTLTPA